MAYFGDSGSLPDSAYSSRGQATGANASALAWTDLLQQSAGQGEAASFNRRLTRIDSSSQPEPATRQPELALNVGVGDVGAPADGPRSQGGALVEVEEEDEDEDKDGPACETGGKVYCTYAVQPGDTLSGIAAGHGIQSSPGFSTSDLLAFNNDLEEEDYLRPGQELRIPVASGVIHNVLVSDTLSAIAARYGVSVADILALPVNGLPNANTVIAGQDILVPSPRTRPAVALTRSDDDDESELAAASSMQESGEDADEEDKEEPRRAKTTDSSDDAASDEESNQTEGSVEDIESCDEHCGEPALSIDQTNTAEPSAIAGDESDVTDQRQAEEEEDEPVFQPTPVATVQPREETRPVRTQQEPVSTPRAQATPSPTPSPTASPAPSLSASASAADQPVTSTSASVSEIKQQFTAGYRSASGPENLLTHILERVIPCESSYNVRAYNPAGPYYGLMQFLPATWNLVGGGEWFNAWQQGANTARLILQRDPKTQWPVCWSR